MLNSLSAMDGRDRPLFHKLRACLVTTRIYVYCYHLIGRKLAENFSFFAVNSTCYAACSNNDVSRVSLSCFYCASFLGDCGVVMYRRFGHAKSSPQKFPLKFTQNVHKSILGTPHNHPTFHFPFCLQCLAPSSNTSPSTRNGRRCWWV